MALAAFTVLVFKALAAFAALLFKVLAAFTALTLGAFTAFLALAAQALDALTELLTESLAVFAAKLALINISSVRAIDLSVRCGDIGSFAQRDCRRAFRHQRRGR